MSQIPKMPGQHQGNWTEDQKAAKQSAFDIIVTGTGKPVPNARIKSRPAMKKMFERIASYNEFFTEEASDDINTLVISLYQKDKQEKKWLEVNESEGLDEDYDRLQIRIDKLDKKIDNARKNLGLTPNAKFRMANDLANS